LRFNLKLLLLPASYPQQGAEWAGAQNERSARALQRLVDHVEVVCPRPYAPRFLALSDRWRPFTIAPAFEVRGGIRVHRPAYPVAPKLFQPFWPNRAAVPFCRRTVSALHRDIGFDAILSFDLARTGGLAWRLGRAIGIPACGWATGSDMRHASRSAAGRSLRGALRSLDLVFYQSRELRTLAAQLQGVGPESLSDEHHIVQPRGVEAPEKLPGDDTRFAIRSSLGLSDGQVVILYLGRIVRGKGLFELVDGFVQWGWAHHDVTLLLVGSRTGHDDAPALEKVIASSPSMADRIRVLPGCEPRRIWDYLAAADIFAFPSFKEGMPNSLLEAMLAGIPAVAFSIPPVGEIGRFGGGLLQVPPYDFAKFGEALLALVKDPMLRRDIGERGRVVASEHFSLRKNTQLVVEHIASLVARVGAAGPESRRE